jgi:hypothetical protein
LRFPEAPRPIIFVFNLLIKQQYFFFRKTSAPKHPHQQAKAGASGPNNNVIV